MLHTYMSILLGFTDLLTCKLIFLERGMWQVRANSQLSRLHKMFAVQFGEKMFLFVEIGHQKKNITKVMRGALVKDVI